MKITAEVETISPNEARRLLDSTEGFQNRHVARVVVDRLTDQIRRGLFVINGETIIIGSDGKLMNGQHRLIAVSKADISIRTLVARGVDPDTFVTIDTGKARNVADAMLIASNGELSSSTTMVRAMASAARHIVATDKDNRVNYTDLGLVSNADCVELMLSDDDFIDDAVYIAQHRKWPVPPSCLIYIRYMTRAGFSNEIDDGFLGPLQTGVNLHAGHPVLALRNRVLHPDPKKRPAPRYLLPIAIRTWNAFAAGKILSKVQYNPEYGVPSIIRWPGEKERRVRTSASQRMATNQQVHRKQVVV